MKLYKTPSFQLFLFLVFSFFLIFRPFEGFFVEYAVNVRHLNVDMIVEDIYPFWTYSYPFALLILGILSEWEYFGHKWVLLIGTIVSQLSTIAVILPPIRMPYSLGYLVTSQLFFATYFASHTSFFGLRYHVFKKERIHLITSLVRSTMLSGRVLASILGQTIFSISAAFSKRSNNLGIRILPYLDLFSTLPCIAAVFFFPSPQHYRRTPEDPMNESKGKKKKCFLYCYYFLKDISFSVLRDYCLHYKVVFWSIFAIGSSSIHSLMLTYYQPLFQQLDSNINFNGLAIAVMHIMAAVTSFFPYLIRKELKKYDEFIVVGLIPVMSILLVSLGWLTSVDVQERQQWFLVVIGYGMLCFYHAIYEFLNTASYAQIAMHVQNLRFTSIFVLNSLFQVPIQIGLSMALANSSQIFMTLGVLLMCVAVVLMIISAGHQIYKFYKKLKELPEEYEDDLLRIKKIGMKKEEIQKLIIHAKLLINKGKYEKV